MTSAKFASLHSDLLARKGRATPATGEVNAASKHPFETETLELEPGSHKETEIPAMVAAAPEAGERIHEAEDTQQSPPVVEPEIGIELRPLDPGSPLEQSELHSSESRDSIERRDVNRGAPPGMPERRRPPVFGKRGAIRASISEISQKRFNA